MFRCMGWDWAAELVLAGQYSVGDWGVGHSLETGLLPACSLGTHSYKFMSCVIKSFIFVVFHFFNVGM